MCDMYDTELEIKWSDLFVTS